MNVNDDSLGPSVTPKLAMDDKSLIKVLISVGVLFWVGLLVSAITALRLMYLVRKYLKK